MTDRKPVTPNMNVMTKAKTVGYPAQKRQRPNKCGQIFLNKHDNSGKMHRTNKFGQ